MKQSFRTNISANFVQLFINQGFSLLAFYFLSKGLSKAEFGQLNWALAALLIVFGLLSFGIDQLIVKKTAEGKDKNELLSLHLLHVTGTGLFFYVIIIACSFLPVQLNNLMLLLAEGKLLLFFSAPFKSVAAGMQNFKAVMYISIPGAVMKGLCTGLLFFSDRMTLSTVVPVFIFADGLELFFGIFFLKRSCGVRFRFQTDLKKYVELLREAIPQIGVVIFSSALARIDWVLIGAFLSVSKLAEYSFAYKVFEFAGFPLLMIAPLLVPYFTELIRKEKNIYSEEKVQLLFRTEMIIASLAALCLNLLWPVVDFFTDSKYGSVNSITILLFSACLPVLFLNNFLWSIHFAAGNMRIIFYSFAICFLLNLTCNLIFIPSIGSNGAALAYLVSLVGQTFYQYFKLKNRGLLKLQPFFVSAAAAFLCGLIVRMSPPENWWLIPASIALYIGLLFLTFQLRKNDAAALKTVIMKGNLRSESAYL